MHRRRRFWWGAFKWTVGVGLVAAAGVSAYQSGSVVAELDVVKLKEEIARLSQTVVDLQREKAELQATVKAAERRTEEWRHRYQENVPTGEMRELLEIARRKVAAGVEPSRLAFVIGAAEQERDCDDAPVTKRFIAQTPLYKGANDSVSFADNAITVTAEGRSATDAEGNAEAWFDPAQPVTVRFTQLGGKSSEVSANLPLHHSVRNTGSP
jgi:hypothetical protein